MEITVTVVHDYLVEMAYDGGTLALNHGVGLVKEGLYGTPDVATKMALEPVIVDLIVRTVNHPKVLSSFLGMGA